MPAPPLFLCPRLLVRTAPALARRTLLAKPLRQLSTAPAVGDTPAPPPLVAAGESVRPTVPIPTSPPLAIEHHDALLSSSAADALASKEQQKPRPRKYGSDTRERALAQHVRKDYGYQIARTARGGEPVYEDYVRNGRARTLVRLIHGDSKKLCEDLLETLFKPLGVTDEKLESRIRMPGHIELRGHWRPQIVGWMRERGW